MNGTKNTTGVYRRGLSTEETDREHVSLELKTSDMIEELPLAPSCSAVAWGPDRESLYLSELLQVLQQKFVAEGDMLVEVRNEAGDLDTARGVYVTSTHHSGKVLRITPNGEDC